MTTPMPWASLGACQGLDPELFVLVGTEPPPQEARDACAACFVRADCLAHALEWREWGYWGGTTDDERAVLRRRQQRRAAKGAA